MGLAEKVRLPVKIVDDMLLTKGDIGEEEFLRSKLFFNPQRRRARLGKGNCQLSNPMFNFQVSANGILICYKEKVSDLGA